MSSYKVREKIRLVPKEPGCYLMKDALGRIIYVGKAKNLKARVSQYFNAQVDSRKTRVLVEHIADFELIITQNEIEALLLERTLIKHHKPRFNVLLRDDKEYPFLRINFHEEWPRIEKVRRRKDDGATYLGPFSSGSQLRILVDAALRIFPVVRCSRYEFSNAKRPCNYYHMKMCLAPCTQPVSQEQYKATVQDAVQFLSGKNDEVINRVKAKMAEASEQENFELAALYRDQLKAFTTITERQNVVSADIDDADVIGLEQKELKTSFHVLTIRNYQLVGQDSFVLRSEVADREDALLQFVLQYYESRSLPRDLLLPFAFEGIDSLQLALMHHHPDASSFSIHVPMRGSKKDLVDMAQKNATYKLTELEIQTENSRTELLLLQEKFSLSHVPHRMECIDISNIQGTAIVASNVCFIDGKPAKEYYRHYNITSVSDGPNDFKSINEVVARRLTRALRDGDMPQLLVIDGGRGQLSAAWQAFQEFFAQHNPQSPTPLATCDLIALAKAKGQPPRGGRARHGPERAFERVFRLGQEVPILLSPGTPEYRLLTQLRDEAHRFAITHHRKSRSKLSLTSPLMEIPGIGKNLQKKLMLHYGSLDQMRQAPLEELLKFKGLRQTSAVALHSFLQNLSENSSIDPDSTQPPAQRTIELLIRILAPDKIKKTELEEFLRERGYPEFVDAMIDGIQDPLPLSASAEEDLWEQLDQPTLPLCVYHEDQRRLEELQSALSTRFGQHIETHLTPLANDSWQESWVQTFTPIITPRFEVRALGSEDPVDEENTVMDRPVIKLIPSHGEGPQSHEVFGDGRHGTTEVCLRILSDLCPEKKSQSQLALDVGTGSGVLALAMGLLGFKHIVMTDLDDSILNVARPHLELNAPLFDGSEKPSWDLRLTERIPPPPDETPYGLITANILVPVLHELLGEMEQHLAPGGHLLLSGFIEKESHGLMEAALRLGLKVVLRDSCRGWLGILLRKNPGP